MADKLLTLLRGLSGSGKSQKAKELGADSGKLKIIISTDDYWYGAQGNYNFDYNRIGEAHQWAQTRAIECMEDSVPHVIIDNTNARWWEMFPYLEAAHRFSYKTNIVMVGGIGTEDIALYAARNIHDVPLEIIKRQASNFEMMMDPEAGFFLESLRQKVTLALKEGFQAPKNRL